MSVDTLFLLKTIREYLISTDSTERVLGLLDRYIEELTQSESIGDTKV